MNIKTTDSYNLKDFTGVAIHIWAAGFNLDGLIAEYGAYTYINGSCVGLKKACFHDATARFRGITRAKE